MAGSSDTTGLNRRTAAFVGSSKHDFPMGSSFGDLFRISNVLLLLTLLIKARSQIVVFTATAALVQPTAPLG